jgi:hypothetical protein
MPGMKYDDARATPEYIERERARKRLVNREAWVKAWFPRIEEEVKNAKVQSERV